MTPSPQAPVRASATLAAATGAADCLAILLFAAVGREAHERGDILAGVLLTAWPFLTGAATAWVILRAWRQPLAIWPAGVGVWLGTVTIGMLLRAATGQTVVLPFILVALLSIGLLLLGYRLLAGTAVRRLRLRRRSVD